MTREYYNSLDIRTLRMMGKEIGVKAPTRLNKADLIEQIILVESGVVAPVRKKQENKEKPQLKSINNVVNEPPQEAVPSHCEEARMEQNYNRQPQYYNSTQNNARKHEFVLQKIRTVENLIKEIYDYIIYEGL